MISHNYYLLNLFRVAQPGPTTSRSGHESSIPVSEGDHTRLDGYKQRRIKTCGSIRRVPALRMEKEMPDYRKAILLLAAGWFLAVASPALADPAPSTDFSKGAFYGKVVDTASGQPVAGATVAIRDKNGKVVAWTKTDAQGQYAIAADSLKLLQLRPSRRRGLLAGIARGVTKVVTAPVKIAADAIKEADPVKTAKAAAVTAATGNPVPAITQVTAGAVKSATEQKLREKAAKSVLGERQTTPKEKRDTVAPGELFLAVSAPNYQEIKGKAGAYWLEPPAAAAPDKKPVGTRAWLETVKLAPVGSDKKSEIENTALLLAEPRMDPSMAPAGSSVKISVKLQVPPGQALNVRVFAREDKKKKVVELKAQEGGVFAGELPLDPKTPAGDTTVTVVALRAEPVEVSLRDSKADPLLDFAERLDDLDADKPYDFDPRIMASENRLDMTLTVLDPRQATPTAPSPPAQEGTPKK